MSRRKLLCALAASLIAAPAAAQTEEPVAAVPVATAEQSTPAQGQGSETPQQLASVLVTGELIARESDRTTASVAIHSGAQIARSTARDAYDVIRATPNASWHDSELGLPAITLRGIGSYGASQVGSGTIYGTATAIVLDGVALPRAAMGFADLSVFDLEQVEIFRGPQSTSQGRNAMAGAVIINSTEPQVADSFSPELRTRFAAGSDNTWQSAAVIGATLVPDLLSIRLVTDHRTSDGDIANETRNEDDWAHDRNHGTRLRMKLMPGGPDGSYEAILGAGDSRRDTGNRYVQQSREAELIATADEPSGIENHAQLFSLDQRLRLSEAWSLRAVSAYAQSKVLLHLDVDYSTEPAGFIAQEANSHAFSQELRAIYESERWRATLGAYWYKGIDGEASSGRTSVKSLLNATGLCSVPGLCLLPLGSVLVIGDAPARFENLAFFGETDWHATERLTITAGLRLDHERNSRRVLSKISGDTPTASLAVAALKAAGTLGEDGETNVGRSFSALLPKVAASYEVFDGGFLGVAYTEGYRPGGEGYNYGSGRRYSFDAERTQNIELSFKGHTRLWQTQYALNVFHVDWSDMQVPVGALLDSYIANAGNSRIRGGEFEFTTRPLESLRLFAGLGITRGRFVDFVATQGDYSGNPLPKAPGHSARVALEWMPLGSVLIRPEWQRTGSTPAQADNGPTHQLPAYNLINLTLRWQRPHYSLFVNGSNLTDQRYRLDAATDGLKIGDIAAPGYSRQILGGIEMNF